MDSSRKDRSANEAVDSRYFSRSIYGVNVQRTSVSFRREARQKERNFTQKLPGKTLLLMAFVIRNSCIEYVYDSE